MRRAPTTPPGTAGSTSPPRRARRCAPPTTASSASPVRSPARCTSPSPTRAISAPRTRSSSSVGVRIGQPVTRGDVVGAHRRRRHRPRRPRAPPRAAHRRPLRRPDAAVPPARPHHARAPGARGRPCRDPVVPGRRAARVAVVAAPADARWRRRPWRDRVRRLVRHRCPAARRRRRRGLRPRHVAGRRRRRGGRRRSAIPRRHHRPRRPRRSTGLRATVDDDHRPRCARCRRSWRARWPGPRPGCWRSTSSPSGDASPTPSPPTAATTRPMPTAPVGPRTG